MLEVYGRSDYAIIGELVEPGTRVLDLGCGEGELLAWLKENKNVDGRGVEMTGARVQKAIARGVSVYQGDLESALDDYPDQAFDYVILSQTLAGDARSSARAARHAAHRASERSSRFRISATGPCAWRICGAGARRKTETVPARLVRFAEHPFPDGARFRGAGAQGKLARGAADFSIRPAASAASAESDRGKRGVLVFPGLIPFDTIWGVGKRGLK